MHFDSVMYVLCGVVCIAVFQANGIMRQKSKRSRAADAAAVALLGAVSGSLLRKEGVLLL